MIETILLIEPSTAFAEVLRDILELEGYRVVIASNSQQGLRIIAEMQPDLVICSDELPTMPGRDFLQQLRAEEANKEGAFIMMHGAWVPPSTNYAWVQKPFSVEALLTLISSFH